MDNNQLSRFFPGEFSVDLDTQAAISDLYRSAQDLAQTLNRLLPESQAKVEMIMSLYHLVRNVEMSLRLDGPSRMTPMIVQTRQ